MPLLLGKPFGHKFISCCADKCAVIQHHDNSDNIIFLILIMFMYGFCLVVYLHHSQTFVQFTADGFLVEVLTNEHQFLHPVTIDIVPVFQYVRL